MRALLGVLLCLCGLAHASDGQWRLDRPHPVEDPAYGQILYDYYQQRYFAAMSHILIGLETGALPTQQQRAQVLLGALYANYGMPREAEQLFDALLDKAVDEELATRVWIHLGNLYYQQQRYQQALDTLDQRVKDVPDDLQQNYHALRTRILMKMGRYDDTTLALDALPHTERLSGYLRYNLAVSRINAGEGKEGEALLWQLVNLPPGDEEINSLKDKSMLALGVHYLRSGSPRRAQEVLGAARLEGPYSETALLLHARAWLATQEPDKALGSLQALSERSMQFEEAQEAAIALPYLFEQLGDAARARALYRRAIEQYTAHYRYLGELEEKVRSGAWFKEVAREPHWSTAMDPVPPFQPRRVESFATFRQVFASHAFHTRWLDYHEQWRQLRLLEHWQQRLPALHELLAAHIRKHRDQMPRARALLEQVDEANYPARLKQLQAQFDRAVAENDYALFANDAQAELLDALAQAQEKAARWDVRLSDEQKHKLDFYARVLRWDIESNLVPLQWQRERELLAASGEVASLNDYRQRVDDAARGDLGRIQMLGHELADTHNDLVALTLRGHALLQRQQYAIEQLALEQIEFTRERLKAFTAECWVALGDLENRVLRERYRAPASSADTRSSE